MELTPCDSFANYWWLPVVTLCPSPGLGPEFLIPRYIWLLNIWLLSRLRPFLIAAIFNQSKALSEPWTFKISRGLASDAKMFTEMHKRSNNMKLLHLLVIIAIFWSRRENRERMAILVWVLCLLGRYITL